MKILMRSLIAAGALAAGLALSTHDAAATVVNLTNPNFDANVGSHSQLRQLHNGHDRQRCHSGLDHRRERNGHVGHARAHARRRVFQCTRNWSPPQVGAVGGTTLGGFGPSSILQNTGRPTSNGTSGTVTVNLSAR